MGSCRSERRSIKLLGLDLQGIARLPDDTAVQRIAKRRVRRSQRSAPGPRARPVQRAVGELLAHLIVEPAHPTAAGARNPKVRLQPKPSTAAARVAVFSPARPRRKNASELRYSLRAEDQDHAPRGQRCYLRDTVEGAVLNEAPIHRQESVTANV